MLKKIVLCFCFISFLACAGKIYNKQFFLNPNYSIKSYSYVVIAKKEHSQELKSQITISSPMGMPYASMESIIEGAILKSGFTLLSQDELLSLPEDKVKKVLVSKWGISGRKDKAFGSYSQEVTVVLTDYITKEYVYRGIGEYMGASQLDDIKGALTAALEGLYSKN